MKKEIRKPLDVFGVTLWSYAILDIILSFLAREIRRKDLPEELQNKTDDELQAEYNKRFPVLYGKALQDMSRDIDTDDSEYLPIHA